MAVVLRSFAKINIGLAIGPPRGDGFHELCTVYQTIALHDVIRIEVERGSGIEIRSENPAVPCDESNTCHRIAERVLKLLKKRSRVVIQIEKRLPVQGGLGGASSNGVATLLGLERELKHPIPMEEKLRIAAEVGSDLPLFLVGGTVLGVGRGEQVFPLPDLPQLECVVAAPSVGVSTPRAFAAWDALQKRVPKGRLIKHGRKLTSEEPSGRIEEFSRSLSAWLSGFTSQQTFASAGGRISGVLRGKGRGDRAEALLLDLVRAGIENDFERVVFPEHPELREVKRVLERHEARYASLSGSGSAVYGVFGSHQQAELAAAMLNQHGTRAEAVKTLARGDYWKQVDPA